MRLSFLDLSIICIYFIISIVVGILLSKKAGKNLSEFFTAGKSLPWWLAGTSMVATTFAADTPLAVTELVYKYGVAGNWLWWSSLFSGTLTVFFFAKLWKRTGIMTDVEFTELRYSGKPASFLRGFRAIYLGVIINSVVIGWVICAMGTIIEISLGVNRWLSISVCLLITVFYSSMSGLWGVILTDFFQFIVAMTGSIALAIFGLRSIGGMTVLKEKLIERTGSIANADAFLSVLPPLNSAWMPAILFFTYIGIQWWASSYPGSEPGGGCYVAQRMFSCKNEKHSLYATLWFNLAHYALRPWPWIITALIAFIVYPNLERPKEGYVLMMVNYLPSGMLGLMFASLAAAFMSTISTQLNLGSSYFINDFYKRFLKTKETETHYIKVSRLATIFLMLIGAVVAFLMESISSGWEFVLAVGAGTGPVYIFRWFWSRINAWSEISATLCAFITALSLKLLQSFDFLVFPKNLSYAYEIIITVCITSIVWLTVTFLTKSETEKTLQNFYLRAKPAGRGWNKIKQSLNIDTVSKNELWIALLSWIVGTFMIYTLLFAIGKLILKDYKAFSYLFTAALIAAFLIYKLILKSNKETKNVQRI